MSDQAIFTAALLAPGSSCPPGLGAWNGSDPAARFAVYRNNVVVSLVDVLADSFPVTQQLVGETFFRAMARIHALACPPRNPCLASYGQDFPSFIASFEPAAALPYLADVAHLELLRIAAYHAADTPALSPERLRQALADAAALPGLRCALHPSLGVLQSAYAVVALWAAHQGLGDLAAVDPGMPQSALVLRVGLEVEVVEIPRAAGGFVACLQQGGTFADAMAAAIAVDAAFDPFFSIGLLIHKGALTALIPEESHHDA